MVLSKTSDGEPACVRKHTATRPAATVQAARRGGGGGVGGHHLRTEVDTHCSVTRKTLIRWRSVGMHSSARKTALQGET